ncbi:MAG: hypothetical protein E7365_01370 [Clostridiales bacterium]|nr:hypothetical protein [Clostridiales bacterium]
MIKLDKKRLITVISALVVLIVILTAVIFAFSNSYKPKKFNNIKHSCSGGQTQKDANLQEITVTEENGIVNINLHFASGSAADEQISKSGIPKYEVSFIESPLRLQINLKELVYWDYMIKGVSNDSQGVINGMFQMSPYEENTDTTLYFNLSKSVKYKVQENDDVLTISLLQDKKDKQKTGWYLACDMYYEYQTGEKTDYGFTPTLCDDKISVIMISQRFKTEAQARKAMEEKLASTLEGVNVRIFELSAGLLPKYTEETDVQALLGESILSIDGAKTTLPLYFADARFLTWGPDGDNALFAKNEEGLEKLYIADKNGAKHLLSEKGFSTVVKATFSKDGTRLAFIEQSETESVITAIGVKTGNITVINNEENLFGEIIMGVQLNETGTKLYCLSGSETYSIKVYDFATNQVTTLKEKILLESDFYYNNGYLYYCDVVDEYEAVVRINTSGGEAELLAKGAQFTLSPDGTKIAVIVEHYETAVSDLRIIDITNNSWDIVYEDVVTTEFFFSSDSKNIYFTMETGDDEFYYQLMKYNVDSMETKGIAQAINSVFYASNKPNEIIISVMYTDDLGSRPATYIADFDKMVVGETME